MDTVEFIKNNLDKYSYTNLCRKLKIHRRTLDKIMKDNNIIDNRLSRLCIKCNSIIFHKTVKNRIRCENENKKCINCAAKARGEMQTGINNHFYGKKHTDEAKSNISKLNKGKRFSQKTEFKKGHKKINQKSNYEYWLIKYGKEIADKKNMEFKKKISIANAGKNNPMYGKPSPISSGNGWSGWYKDWYFRSLLELSYMIFVIERFNLKWESGEKKKNKIQYVIDNKVRNYFPDFIIENKYVIECKPKKLWNTKINSIKKKFGDEYCQTKGMSLRYVDCRRISPKELIELYLKKEISFTKKYDIKINKLINKV